MDLRLFFSPVPEEIFSDIKKQGSFYKNIKIYQERFPDYKSADIALIGISDKGKQEENAGTVGGANALRKTLYKLSKGSGSYNIVDLGNISEDVLKDGRKQYENGLPGDGGTLNTISTDVARLPADQSLVYAFDSEGQQRKNQDVGYDGLSDADEAVKFPNISSLPDPEADNYQYFLNTDGDIVNRY
jgi:hypothetical protein